MLVGSRGGLRQVCVAAPPPPPSFAPIVVPPSTILADLAKTRGDASLPQGMVTFLVGDDRERIEHVSKCHLCIRSGYYRTMFGIGMKERDAAEVTVSHTDLASFTALVRYLLTDQFDLGEEEGRAQRALDLRELAQMYQVPRLELLCAQALQESVGPATAVPLLEAAHTMGDGRLLAHVPPLRGRPRRRGARERRRAARLWRGQGAARRRARPGGGAEGDGGGARRGAREGPGGGGRAGMSEGQRPTPCSLAAWALAPVRAE